MKVTDTQRLDYFVASAKRGFSFNIVNDDAGRWAVSDSGMQEVPEKGPIDMCITHFVEKKQWRRTLRGAIDACMKEHPLP